VPGGKHTVCVDARNVAAGNANPQLGCRTVSVLAGDPFGNLDAAQASGGAVTFWGWAIDPDVTAPISVHVYLDGKLATAVRADDVRADVAAAYGSYGTHHGFSGRLPITAGSHRLCAYAINTAAGSTTTKLGCAAVDG
jgi:hypothetical protein